MNYKTKAQRDTSSREITAAKKVCMMYEEIA